MSQELVINIAHISTKQSLHELFASIFDFPDFYGMNWDAFRDCILDPDLSNIPTEIKIQGMNSLREKLPDDAQILHECFDELVRERPEIQLQYIDVTGN